MVNKLHFDITFNYPKYSRAPVSFFKNVSFAYKGLQFWHCFHPSQHCNWVSQVGSTRGNRVQEAHTPSRRWTTKRARAHRRRHRRRRRRRPLQRSDAAPSEGRRARLWVGGWGSSPSHTASFLASARAACREWTWQNEGGCTPCCDAAQPA